VTRGSASGSGRSAGTVLREWRTLRQLSYRSLARLVPCEHSLLWKIEHDIATLTHEMAERCDEALRAGGALVAAWMSVRDDGPATPEWNHWGVDRRAAPASCQHSESSPPTYSVEESVLGARFHDGLMDRLRQAKARFEVDPRTFGRRATDQLLAEICAFAVEVTLSLSAPQLDHNRPSAPGDRPENEDK
jgi:transcriptional regulator with XRE-family HTH domain